MSQVISLRIPDRVAERLDRFARRLGNGMTRTKAGVMLLEEGLQEAEFSHIEFRDSPLGRQPYMKGSGLAVWEVVMLARHYEFDAERMAKDYPYPVESIQAALNYYESFREEIDQAMEDNRIGYEEMKKLLPGLRLVETPES